MPENRYHTRQAAAALLKMAKSTSNPEVAAALITAAADLKDQVGELPTSGMLKSKDILPEQ
jgi:hypothetical protein